MSTDVYQSLFLPASEECQHCATYMNMYMLNGITKNMPDQLWLLEIRMSCLAEQREVTTFLGDDELCVFECTDVHVYILVHIRCIHGTFTSTYEHYLLS